MMALYQSWSALADRQENGGLSPAEAAEMERLYKQAAHTPVKTSLHAIALMHMLTIHADLAEGASSEAIQTVLTFLSSLA